jgi:hypothetical protein
MNDDHNTILPTASTRLLHCDIMLIFISPTQTQGLLHGQAVKRHNGHVIFENFIHYWRGNDILGRLPRKRIAGS